MVSFKLSLGNPKSPQTAKPKRKIELRGLLRKKIDESKEALERPDFRIREPRVLLQLPNTKRIESVNIRYPLLEPFAFAEIKWDPLEKKLKYQVIEPQLTPEENKKLETIEELLTEIIDVKLSALKEGQLIDYLEDKVRDVLERGKIEVQNAEYIKIMYYIYRDLVGLNEIEAIMHDPYVEDVGCSGLDIPVFIFHRKYGSVETSVIFQDFEHLNNYVIKLSERCGRYISYAKPLLDGTLPDGSRIQASMAKDVTTKGPTFSIRKFRRNPFSPIDILDMNTATSDMLAYLWFLVEHGASILICGGVATGKTTFLNCISMFIPPEYKVISIEDTREINIPHENWIPAVTRVGFGMPEAGGSRYGEVDLFDLLKESFRMKPDYVIVGEVRGREAYVMFQGISSGHPSLGTLHAGSVEDVIKRLVTPPIELSSSLIEALDLIILVGKAREKGESARRVKTIHEIQAVDSSTQRARTVKPFEWLASVDEYKNNMQQSQLIRKISFETGITYQEISAQIEERKRVLEWLKRHDVFHYKDVYDYINMYRKNREELMGMVLRDEKPKGAGTRDVQIEDSVTGLKIVKS